MRGPAIGWLTAQRPFSRVMGFSPATRGDVWAQQAAAGQPVAWSVLLHALRTADRLGGPTDVGDAAELLVGRFAEHDDTDLPSVRSGASPSAGGAFYATPRWPSNTNQFGVYPVRAPW